MPSPLLISPHDISPSDRCFLYGSGQISGLLHEHLHNHGRKVVGYIDSFSSGRCNGLPRLHIDEYATQQQENDTVIITSGYFRAISSLLTEYSINHLNGYFLARVLLEDKKFNHQYLLNDTEIIANFADKYELAATVFKEKRDRDLYKSLIKARAKPDDLNGLKISLSQYCPPPPIRIREQYFSHIRGKEITTIIEGGVSDGINTLEFACRLPRLKALYGFEPSSSYDEGYFKPDIEKRIHAKITRSLLWQESGVVHFDGNAINPEGNQTLQADSIDDYLASQPDCQSVEMIKMDIEGAELAALKGARDTLIKHRPQLAISIYHSNQDMFEIPLFLNNLLEDYVFRLDHHSDHFWETVLYAIPAELYHSSAGS